MEGRRLLADGRPDEDEVDVRARLVSRQLAREPAAGRDRAVGEAGRVPHRGADELHGADRLQDAGGRFGFQQLTKLTGYESNQITLEGSNNDILLLQYLTHKNDTKKYQFPIVEVWSNNEELFQAKYSMQYKSKEQRANELIKDIRECKTLIQLMERQGIETANKYRNSFNQIKREQGANLELMEDLIIRYENFLQDVKSYIRDFSFIDEEENYLIKKLEQLIHKYDL